MRELPIKPPLSASHKLAPGSDPQPPAVSHPEFTSHSIEEKIPPKSNRKRCTVESSSQKGTTNTLPGPESFDDVVQRQKPPAVRIEWL